jgi:prevent-host-death family protein
MDAETITVAQARGDFSNLMAQTELLDRRFIIARRGKPKAALVSVRDLKRLENLDRGITEAPSDRDRAIQAMQQAGLLRSVSADLVSRYAGMEPAQREAVRRELMERRFDPPLSEQIIADRGED